MSKKERYDVSKIDEETAERRFKLSRTTPDDGGVDFYAVIDVRDESHIGGYIYAQGICGPEATLFADAPEILNALKEAYEEIDRLRRANVRMELRTRKLLNEVDPHAE